LVKEMVSKCVVRNLGGKMNRELAEEILKINLKELEVSNRKWAIRKAEEKDSWDQVCTEAMQYLLENKNA
jgi:hypothetical protein